MHILSIVIDIILAGYVTWEVLRFGPQYRQLKQDIANGDTPCAHPCVSEGHRFRMGQRPAGAACPWI